MKKILVVLGIVSIVFIASGSAQASMVDLTIAGADGWINGAYFIQIDPKATGTGHIHTFVQIGDARESVDPTTGKPYADIVEAYNTTVNGTLDNGSSATFNHELHLSEIPLVDINGTLYRQFLLDINQHKSSKQHPTAGLLSLDEIQIFLSDTPNQGVESFTGGILDLADSELIYQLDEETNNWIKLLYDLNHGSGSGDMFAYIPDELFNEDYEYVYLYSRFGENFTNNDGFEEWATLNPNVPEPATMSLLGLGLLGLVGLRRKR